MKKNKKEEKRSAVFRSVPKTLLKTYPKSIIIKQHRCTMVVPNEGANFALISINSGSRRAEQE